MSSRHTSAILAFALCLVTFAVNLQAPLCEHDLLHALLRVGLQR